MGWTSSSTPENHDDLNPKQALNLKPWPEVLKHRSSKPLALISYAQRRHVEVPARRTGDFLKKPLRPAAEIIRLGF